MDSLLGWGWTFEGEHVSEHGSAVGTDFLHLLVVLGGVLSFGHLGEGLSHLGKFTNENEHVLGEVLGKFWHSAGFLISSAHGPNVEERLLEVALREISGDFGSLSEKVHVRLDILELEHGEWVLDDATELHHVVDGLDIHAFGKGFIT